MKYQFRELSTETRAVMSMAELAVKVNEQLHAEGIEGINPVSRERAALAELAEYSAALVTVIAMLNRGEDITKHHLYGAFYNVRTEVED